MTEFFLLIKGTDTDTLFEAMERFDDSKAKGVVFHTEGDSHGSIRLRVTMYEAGDFGDLLARWFCEPPAAPAPGEGFPRGSLLFYREVTAPDERREFLV